MSITARLGRKFFHRCLSVILSTGDRMGGYLWSHVLYGWIPTHRGHGTEDTTVYGRQAGDSQPTGMLSCYRPQRSCGQGNVFTGVCLSTGGRVSASVHARMPYPPGTRQTPPRDQADTPRTRQTPPRPGRPPRTRQTPPDQADTPPDQADPPRTRQTPPDQADPPGKQTPAYGVQVASTHPTGMHSC